LANLPTGRTGQLLAVTILAAAIGSAYLLIAIPVQDFYLERQAVLEDRGMLASRLVVAATELPGLRARLAELRAAANTSKVTLDGANDAIASADLQSRVEALATSLGVTLGSTESLAAEDRGGFRRIGLRIVVSGEYESLVRLFGAIETSVPPLVLDNLRIRNVLRPAGMAGSAKLDAGFEVYGVRGNDAPISARR
jgi:general secretion pathway protein M